MFSYERYVQKTTKFHHFEIQQSKIMLCSCLLLITPGFLLLKLIERSTKWVDFVIYFFMCLFSVLGDYVYVVEKWHIIPFIDQWTALFGISMNVVKCVVFYVDAFHSLTIAISGYVAITLYRMGQMCSNFDSWVIYHSLFHVTGWLLCICTVLNEYSCNQ